MRIFSTQPIQDLFFTEQDAPINTSSKNLRAEEGTPLQENPSSSAIRRSHPKLSIIKTDKTGPQNWSPLAKLALATAGIVKATALGYLAYTYNSTAPQAPSTPDGKFINIPAPTPTATTAPDSPTSTTGTDTPPPSNYVAHDILNQESPSISSLPLVITAGTICLVIGGILGSLIKGKTEDSSFQKNPLRIPPDRQEIIDLEQEVGRLISQKENLEKQKNEILAQRDTVRIEIEKTNTQQLAKKRELQDLTTKKNTIENEIRVLELKRANASRPVSSLPSENSDLETESLRLKGEISLKKIELDEVERRKVSFEKQIVTQKQTKETLEKQVIQLNDSTQNLKSEITNLAHQKQRLDEELLAKRTRIEDQIQELETQCEVKKSELDRQLRKLEEGVETKKRNCNQEIEELKKSNSQKESEIKNKTQKEIKGLDQDLEAKQLEYDNEIKERKDFNQNEITRLETELREKTLELENELKTKRLEFNQEIEELEKSTSQTKSSIENEIQQKIKHLNEDLEAQRIEFDNEINERRNDIQNEITRLENELRERTLELENNLETKKREFNQVIEELENSTSQTKSSIENEIQRLNQDLKTKQYEYDKEIKELENSTSQKKYELEENLKNTIRELEENLKAKQQEILDDTAKFIEKENKTRKDHLATTLKIIETTQNRQNEVKLELAQFENQTLEAKNSLTEVQRQLATVCQELEQNDLKLKEKKQELQNLTETQQREAQKPKNTKPIKTEAKESITYTLRSSSNPVKLEIETKHSEDLKTKKEAPLTGAEKIAAAQAEYNKLVEVIKEAKRARVQNEQDYDTTSQENYKKELSALTTFLVELAKSDHAGIQQIIYQGFVELLKYSPREATKFAVVCLDSDRMGCKKVASQAFTDLIHKYQEVKSKFEQANQQNKVDFAVARYPSEVLKKAILFARQCKKKEKINLGIDSINKLDLPTLKDIYLTLFKNEPHSAIKFIDIFLDVLAKFETQKNKEFNDFIGTELQLRNRQIYNAYLAAQFTREVFNPKEIVTFLPKQAKSNIELKVRFRGKTTKKVQRSLKNPKNLPVVSKDVAFDDRSWLLPKNPRPKKPSIPSNVPSIGSSNVFSNPPPQRQITDSDNPWMSSLGNLGTSSLTQSPENPAYPQISRDDPLNQSSFFSNEEPLPTGDSQSLFESYIG